MQGPALSPTHQRAAAAETLPPLLAGSVPAATNAGAGAAACSSTSGGGKASVASSRCTGAPSGPGCGRGAACGARRATSASTTEGAAASGGIGASGGGGGEDAGACSGLAASESCEIGPMPAGACTAITSGGGSAADCSDPGGAGVTASRLRCCRITGWRRRQPL